MNTHQARRSATAKEGIVRCLAATCHDPLGLFTPGVERAAALLSTVVDDVTINATTQTASSTVAALQHFIPRVVITEHEAGSIGIGAARRQALALATEGPASDIVYSDLDHVLRWASAAGTELVDAVTEPRPGTSS